MTDRQIALIRAATEAVWTVTLVGIIAYAGRRNIIAFLAKRRAEIDARTAIVRERETALRNRLGFARHDRARIMGEEFDVIAPRIGDDGWDV